MSGRSPNRIVGGPRVRMLPRTVRNRNDPPGTGGSSGRRTRAVSPRCSASMVSSAISATASAGGGLLGRLVLDDGLHDRLDGRPRRRLPRSASSAATVSTIDSIVLARRRSPRSASSVGDGLEDLVDRSRRRPRLSSAVLGLGARSRRPRRHPRSRPARWPRSRRRRPQPLDLGTGGSLEVGLVRGDGLDDRLDRLARRQSPRWPRRLATVSTIDSMRLLGCRRLPRPRRSRRSRSTVVDDLRRGRLLGGLVVRRSRRPRSTSAAASCWRTWAKADARVLSMPPSGSWTASDIE